MTDFFRQTHRRWIAGIVGAIVLMLLIASCVPARPVAVGYAPIQQAPVVTAPAVVGAAPVVVTPAPAVVHHDSGFGSAFAGSMLGSMIGNGFGSRSTHTTVVERHTTTAPVTTTAPAQRYATPAPTYRPPVTQSYQSQRGVTSTVTTRPSTFGTTSGRTSISVGRRR